MLLSTTCAYAEQYLSSMDLENLKAAMEVTRAGVKAGESPFGAVVAGPDGSILMTQYNVSVSTHDQTKHAESMLASRFCQAYYKHPEFRSKCTLYSSMEPCAMCMYTMFSAGIGRVVYGLSADRLYELFDQYGSWPRTLLSSHQAASYMSSPMIVVGPHLEDEAAAIVDNALKMYEAKRLIKKKGTQ